MNGRTSSQPPDAASRPSNATPTRCGRRAGALAAILLAGLVGLAGCGGSDGTGTEDTASPTTVPATGSPPSPSPVPSETETGGSGSGTTSTTSGGGVTTCTARQLAVSAGRQEGAAGRQYRVVVFTNTGDRTCRLRGYPAVAGLDTAGTVVARARQASGFPLGTVTLDGGDAASALVQAGSVPRGTDTCPPDYAALSVAPPRQSAATRLAVTLPACDGLLVRPVVAGVTGE